ncbi:YeiH family protein [Lysobacter koreensis]|uniref:YeiH family protein n=1 Tax=Lysobacter koreensis TaxID=266122 RepID=A0ABW2YNX9_9GAMM
MAHAASASSPVSLPRHRPHAFWLGLLLAAVIAAVAIAVAGLPRVQGMGLSALTLAIVLGIAIGNSVFPAIAAHTAAGVDFSRSTLLRVGIVLYGFRVTFQDIAGVGVAGLLIALVVVASVFGLAVWLGTRVFKLDRETAMLIGAGSAICGAAAVMAAQPVVRGQAPQVAVAVATVVVFGTLGMFVYPWLYPHLGFSEHAYGIYVGSTIHEVAQVVVAGKAVGEHAASVAVIEKMLRVMLLAPFLLLLSARLRQGAGGGDVAAGARGRVTVPWFAVLFIVVSGFNSLQLLPPASVAAIVQLDTALLAMAMAALGLRTHVGAVRHAGMRPLVLAASLFAVLVVGGWALNLAVGGMLATAA